MGAGLSVKLSVKMLNRFQKIVTKLSGIISHLPLKIPTITGTELDMLVRFRPSPLSGFTSGE